MAEWNRIDKLIAEIRYSKINKYIPENGVICDIGCGRSGEFLIRNSHKIRTGYGFDFRVQDLKFDNIILMNNSNHNGKIQLPDECCDAVFLIAVLEHLKNPAELLYEIRRILRGGGYLY